MEAALIHAIEGLTRELALHRSLCQLVTKHDLRETEQKIMSAIQQFAAKQTAFNEQIGTAIAGIQGDIHGLNDKITALQNSPGTITPEDQALLDGLEAAGKTLADKLSALDALTPPVVPVATQPTPDTTAPEPTAPPAA